MKRHPSVQAVHLRLEAIEDGVVRLAGGQERAVLEVGGVNVGLQAAGEQEALLASYAAVLNSLRFPVQILVRVVPIDLAPALDDVEHRARHLLGEPLATLAHDHVAFLRRLARQRTLLERHFYLVVPADAEPAPGRRSWSFGRRPSPPAGLATRQQLVSRCSEVVRQLGRCGLTARPLGDAELLQLFYACWCPELARTQRLRRARDIDLPVIQRQQREGNG
jgi:hypothetical protein